MPPATLPPLTPDQIDDLLYLARLGETADLKAALDLLANTLSTTPATILTVVVNSQDSGNGLLHMAAANGHTATLKSLLFLLLTTTPLSSSSSSPSNSALLSLNLRNKAGNTPLHWAALNGHLPAVKLLVGAGADRSVVNEAGKDAVLEAEAGGKDEVAAWLLAGGKGGEGVGGGGGEEVLEGGGGDGGVGGGVEEVVGEEEGQM